MQFFFSFAKKRNERKGRGKKNEKWDFFCQLSKYFPLTSSVLQDLEIHVCICKYLS